MNHCNDRIDDDGIPRSEEEFPINSASLQSTSSNNFINFFNSTTNFCQNKRLNQQQLAKYSNTTVGHALFNSPHNLVANGFLAPELLSILYRLNINKY